MTGIRGGQLQTGAFTANRRSILSRHLPTTFAAVFIVCSVWQVAERARQQSAAVARIAKTYGWPVYEYALPYPEWCVELCGPHLFGTVTALSWFEWGVFPPDSEDNHRNYAAVGEFPALTSISVFDSAFPIDVLPHCKKLRRLEIIRNGLRDADMSIISKLTSLSTLSLAENEISDVGAAQLHRLQNLRELDLSGNCISATTLAQLQRTLPRCRINCSWSRGSGE